MDLRLYGRVLWRFRIIVALGLVLAVVLGALTILRVSAHGVSYRRSESWSSTARVAVTQVGFPWGRLFATDSNRADDKHGIPVVDPNRLNELTILYAEIAQSDAVRSLMLGDGPVSGQVLASPVVVQDGRYTLPLIDVTGISTTARAARVLARRSTDAFERYIRQRQRANAVPLDDRVVVQTVIEPRTASVYQPRSKTMAIVVFLAVLLATIGLAFLLENLRPRGTAREEHVQAEVAAPARRTA